MPEERPRYSWTLRVGTRLSITRDISMIELEDLLNQPADHQESVKQGLRAYMAGAFVRALVEQRDSMLRDAEKQFDDEWDKMVDAHKKKTGRT